ncbi:Chemotaxis response regulator protein-glutamate methylesterase CheB [Chitinispirillum alkaliphilum]|nr:Chemotaxis response regulator protein-glutamate methylesterase CheB [Chitinispirillum alkaliphilum]
MAIRVMVVDDTVIYRKIASEALGDFSDVEVVCTAPTGDIALRKMSANKIDLVLCDINMPGMDGVKTLEAVRKLYPSTLFVMMSGINTRHADVTIEALQKGALDFIKKPQGSSMDQSRSELRNDLASVLRIVRMRMGLNKPQPGEKKTTFAVAPPVLSKTSLSGTAAPIPSKFSILAIGVSTGGPEALNKLIPSLPSSFPVPVVIVQHMPVGFTKSLAESLNKKSKLTVVEAQNGDVVLPGKVYVAPGGIHMTVRSRDNATIIGLDDGPAENSCKPAVDVLFRSVASVFESKGVLSVILTGMGSDGVKGVKALKKKGCYSITQSASSCVVYGMPKAVDDEGLSDKSVDLDTIPIEICRVLRIS